MIIFKYVGNYTIKSVYFLPNHRNLIKILIIVVVMPVSHMKKKKNQNLMISGNIAISIYLRGTPCK